MNIGIIGNGAWGRALATLVAKAGHQPRLGYRTTRPSGFPGTPNLAGLTVESDLLLLAVPPDAVAAVVEQAQPGAGASVVLATRGLQPHTGGWLSDLIIERTPCRRVGALAGPALAAEVVASRPTALVIASPHQALCAQTQDALHSDICRIYTSTDLPGVELAGAMVLILAMVVGIGDGLDLGIGARAVISTRGMAEATRLGLTLGAQAATFSGLAGSGDLVSSTSHAEHPSYTAGMAIAHGAPCPPQLLDPISSVLALAGRQGVEMPLTQAVLTIASGKARPRLVFDQLMRRQPKSE